MYLDRTLAQRIGSAKV